MSCMAFEAADGQMYQLVITGEAEVTPGDENKEE
jgi:hypothetical protein